MKTLDEQLTHYLSVNQELTITTHATKSYRKLLIESIDKRFNELTTIVQLKTNDKELVNQLNSLKTIYSVLLDN